METENPNSFAFINFNYANLPSYTYLPVEPLDFSCPFSALNPTSLIGLASSTSMTGLGLPPGFVTGLGFSLMDWWLLLTTFTDLWGLAGTGARPGSGGGGRLGAENGASSEIK